MNKLLTDSEVLSSGRLLVVEDSPGDLRLVSYRLDESGWTHWEVDSSPTLAGALPMAASGGYDCILVDLGLPDASGLEAVVQLRAVAENTALVVLTGMDRPGLAEDIIRAGAQDYVKKSMEGLESLPRVIRHAVVRQRAHGGLDAVSRTSQLLLEASHDAALILSPDGTILVSNSRISEMFGAPRESMAGKNIFDLMPEWVAVRRRPVLAEAILSDTPIHLVDTDGFRWYDSRLLAQGSGEQRCCVVFYREITAEKQVAAEMAQVREGDAQINRTKNEFITRMNNEIRVPLTEIMRITTDAGDQCVQCTQCDLPDTKVGLRRIATAGTHILDLIDDMEAVSVLEAAVTEHETTYFDQVERLPDLVCVCVGGRIQRINPAGLNIFRAPTPSACDGKLFIDFVHPDDRKNLDASLESLYQENGPISLRLVAFNGKVVTVELRISSMRHQGVGAIMLVGRDITDTGTSIRAVATREQRYRAILDMVVDGILSTDESGIILSANYAAERILGFPVPELVGMPFADVVSEAETFQKKSRRANFVLGNVEGAMLNPGREVVARQKGGTIVPIYLSMSEMIFEGKWLYTWTISDLGGLRNLEQRVAHFSNYDALTGLPNRTALLERLGQEILSSREQRTGVALLLIDITAFTLINDSLGRSVGDAVLCEVGQRLSRVVSPLDGMVARLGGGKFGVIIPKVADSPLIERLATDFTAQLNHHFRTDVHEIALQAKIAATLFPQDGDEPRKLLRNAELALQDLKKYPERVLGFFNNTMSSDVNERLMLERSLKTALRTGQFELYYQPQMRLSDRKIVGVEALIRWRHPTLGLLLPGKFISIAEETRLIVPIGRWVLQAACQQLKAWNDAGLPPLRMGVNISSLQFREGTLVESVSSVLEETGIDPALLDLELTESMLMLDGEETLKSLKALADLGVRLSIDDFGTGYSSLAYLKRFPVHTVKIDRAFVRDLDYDEDGQTIARAIITLAHSLSMHTIAEGVETKEQMSWLTRHGCDEIQGYLIGRPMAAEAFEWMLTDSF